MDFGVDFSSYDQMDTRLPEGPAHNELNRYGQPGETKIFTGLTKWGDQRSASTLYAKRLSGDQVLPEYARNFNAIELNATHYKIYPPSVIRNWRTQASAENPGFKFCPKVFMGVSHYNGWITDPERMDRFIDSVRYLENNLGPCFLQMPENFSPALQGEFLAFLETLPRDFSLMLELRHPDWFSPEVFLPFTQRVREMGMGMVITDTPARRDVLHMSLTSPEVIIRFRGMGFEPTDISRIDHWQDRIAQWQQKGLQQAYFFIHLDQDDRTAFVSACRYISQKFGLPVPFQVATL